MRNTILYIFLLIASAGLDAQACTADFSYIQDSTGAIVFQDQSNALGNTLCTHNWDFGDGNTSLLQNPTHTYANSGQYTVTLIIETSVDTACSVVSCVDTVELVIDVVNVCDLSLLHTQANVSVNGGNDGSIDLTVINGTPPFTFQWSSGQITEDIMSLVAGTYVVEVNDADGCQAFDTIVIIEPLPCNLVVSHTQVNVSTNGGNDGSIDLIVTNQNPVISYQWSSGQTTQDISSLFAGTYTVAVNDTDGCQAFDTIVITEPLPCNMIVTHTQINVSTIGGNDGSIDLTVLNAGPLVNYQWSSGQTTEDISSLFAGTYTVAVNDTDGCQAFDTIVITEPLPAVEYTLQGQVYAKAALLPEGVALLIDQNNEVVSKTEITSGQYQFMNIDSGQYSVYAVPYFDLDYQYFPIYFPTYYGDANYWTSSSFIIVDSITNADVHLTYFEDILHGQGFLSGEVKYEEDSGFENLIYQQSWFASFRASNNQAASNVTVLLLDESLRVIDFCLTDGTGRYQFSKVPFGSYSVHVEKPGKTMLPLNVQLSQEADSLESLNLTIQSDQIISVPERLASSLKVELYPNPFTDYLQIKILDIMPNMVEVTLMDLTGREVLSQYITRENNLINTKHLEKGAYVLICKSIGKDLFFQKNIKN